jgi:hypothetical protein
LAFDPKEFYALAVWLTGANNTESCLRTAIGRAYFAVHLSALEKATSKKGYQPKGVGDDHSALIRHLRQGPTSGLANRMNSLRMLREHADYHLDFRQTSIPRQCDLCDKAQQQLAPAPTVTSKDWENAKEISERCFPAIDKL